MTVDLTQPDARARHRLPRAGGRWSLAWLPFVVPLCFVVASWSSAQIEFAWLLRPVLVAVVVMTVVTLLCRWLAGPDFGTAAAVAIGVGFVVDDLRLTACAVGIAVVFLGVGRVERRDRTALLRRGLRAYAIVCVALIAVTLAGATINRSLPSAAAALLHDTVFEGPAASSTATDPDIWLILLDGYPGDDAAAELDPAWDRDAFPSALTALGFEVQRNSRTNYPLTRLTLPAMFNGRHIPELVTNEEEAGNLAEQTRLLRIRLEDSLVLRELGAAGYERIAISSGWAEVGPRRVDHLIEPPQLTEFEVELLRDSAMGGLLDTVVPDLYSQQIRERIDTTLKEAAELAREEHERPRFVLVHLPAPHPPVVYDGDGSAVNGSPGASVATAMEPALEREDATRRQLDELEYVGARAEALVRDIQSSTTRPATIVVFSDHGTDIRWDANDPLAGGVNERTSSFLAVFSPGHPGLMPSGTTPVNVLVRILNAYGISNLPVQEDTTWSYRSPASITEVVRIDPATGETR